MTRLATPPDFTEIDANGPELRMALTMAGIILDGREFKLNVYSRHSHRAVPIGDGQVIFEEQVTTGDLPELKLYPLAEAEAAEIGKPSCWAFVPGEGGNPAEVVTLRYASNALHESSGIDVLSPQFQAELEAIASAFVAERIHETLELNATGYLFPAPAGMITSESTYHGYHKVAFIKLPGDIKRGDWSSAACWGFKNRQPVVTGRCYVDDHIDEERGR